MIAFIMWFALLVGIVRVTRGWVRGLFVILYILGSILVAL
jgi:hypothetical protein